MNDFGFYRVSAIAPEVKIAQPDYNADTIIKHCKGAYEKNVDCIVFPELSLTGYTCGDLFDQQLLSSQVEKEIERIVVSLDNSDLLVALGAPIVAFGKRYNCAVLIYKNSIVAIVPKSFLPNYGEFYEKRWFESGRNIKKAEINYAGFYNIPFGTDIIINHKGVKVGIEICEDLWVPNPPSGSLAIAGAEIILNLSASDEIIGKHDYLLTLISQQSARCRCGYVYSSSGWGESSTDLVFIGKAIIGEDGKIYGGEIDFNSGCKSIIRDIDIEKLRLDRAKFNTFAEHIDSFHDYRIINVSEKPSESIPVKKISHEIDPYPFIPHDPNKLNKRCEEIINIQSFGLMKRLEAIGCKKVVIGISGGLDSTLALLISIRAFDKLQLSRKGIIGVTMPGLATTSRTKNNACCLMELLGVTTMEIPIEDAVKIHFKDIDQDPKKYDATYENSQARERTQILMDLANKESGIVIGTGDMSELALGWCTYNGDQMSMYGVNASVPKTLVKHLVEWFASISDEAIGNVLRDICATPISPELVPSSSDDITQKTEDLVGPYELHDFFLYHFLRNNFSPVKIHLLAAKAFEGKYDKPTIMQWLKVFYKRFFSQQFKRSCMPDGPKVGSVNLSPRGDWRMPSDASSYLWIKQLEDFEKSYEN